MQLTSEKKKVQSNIEGQNFTISANSKAFQILSDKLYTNKVKAIIRELSTNALDAHIEAGTPEKPFEIHLPNNLEPYFYVKDWGTGMSEEKVLSLYSSYFSSDKTESNDFVGALGLGSKSPFAYTESFTIESVYNGKKKVYTCYLDEENIPSISKVTEKETDEHPGVKVQVGIKDDYYRWEEYAKEVLRPFNIKPNVFGIEYFESKNYTDSEYLFTGKNWFAYEGHTHYNSSFTVIQGNVEYKASFDDIEEDLRTSYKVYDDAEEYARTRAIFRSLQFVINFRIGQLDVAPSREALSLDKRTRRNLVNKVKEITDEIKKRIKNEYFDDSNTPWQILNNYNTITTILYNESDFIRDIEYKGKPIRDVLVIPDDYRGEVKFYELNEKNGWRLSNYEKHYVKSQPYRPANLINIMGYLKGNGLSKVFENDDSKQKKGIYRLKQNMRNDGYHALVLPREYAKELGINGELNKISELDYIKKPGRGSSKSSNSNSNNTTKSYNIIVGPNKGTSYTKEELEGSELYQNSSELYYVTSFYRKYKDDKNDNREVTSNQISESVKLMEKELEIIDENFTIIEVAKYEMERKRFNDLTKLVPFFTYIEDKLHDIFDDKKVIEKCQHIDFLRRYDDYFYEVETLIKILEKIRNEHAHLFTNKMKMIIDRKEKKDNLFNDNKSDTLKSICDLLEIRMSDFEVFNVDGINKKYKTTEQLIKDFKHSYPIFQIIEERKMTGGFGVNEEKV